MMVVVLRSANVGPKMRAAKMINLHLWQIPIDRMRCPHHAHLLVWCEVYGSHLIISGNLIFRSCMSTIH